MQKKCLRSIYRYCIWIVYLILSFSPVFTAFHIQYLYGCLSWMLRVPSPSFCTVNYHVQLVAVQHLVWRHLNMHYLLWPSSKKYSNVFQLNVWHVGKIIIKIKNTGMFSFHSFGYVHPATSLWKSPWKLSPIPLKQNRVFKVASDWKILKIFPLLMQE